MTDKDIDRLTLSLIDSVGIGSEECNSISKGLALSRSQCNLPYLIGAAPVIYGIPSKLNRPDNKSQQ